MSQSRSMFPEKKPLNRTSWSDIRTVIRQGVARHYWNIGESKTITLNGRVAWYEFNHFPIRVFILGFDHGRARETGNYSNVHFGIGMSLNHTFAALCDDNYDESGAGDGFRMNLTATNAGGWESSYMRQHVLGGDRDPGAPKENTLLAALPADLRDVMRKTTKYTDNVGGINNSLQSVTKTEDSLFLPGSYELATRTKSQTNFEAAYQEPYAFFQNGPGKGRIGHIAYHCQDYDSPVMYWTRTAYSGNEVCFNIYNKQGTASGCVANMSAGLLACFSIY